MVKSEIMWFGLPCGEELDIIFIEPVSVTCKGHKGNPVRRATKQEILGLSPGGMPNALLLLVSARQLLGRRKTPYSVLGL